MEESTKENENFLAQNEKKEHFATFMREFQTIFEIQVLVG